MSSEIGSLQARLIAMINSPTSQSGESPRSLKQNPHPPREGAGDALAGTTTTTTTTVPTGGLAPHAAKSGNLRTIADLMLDASSHYIVRGLVPSRGLIAVFGPPGSGKSFCVMDLVFHIAIGSSDWFGRRLVQAPVAYVALEGQGGLKRRIRAWQAHGARVAPANVRFRTGDLSLLGPEDVQELAQDILAELGVGTVTVIDTLSRAAAGGDENSSTDMSRLIANSELLGMLVSGPVLLVHHTGKNTDKGMRGHSSLLGAVDTAIEVTYANGQRSWKVAKAKDDQAGGEQAFELVSYPVETDQWGDEVRSCAVQPLLGPVVRAVPAPRGKHQMKIMLALRQGTEVAHAGLTWSRALELGAASLSTVSSDRRTTSAKAILQGLILKGNILLNDGLVSLA